LSLNQTPQVEKQIPVIDVDALADLESLEEQGDFSVRELIETFADEAQRNLAGIRAAIASTHAEDLAREAHTLKGSGRDLGTPRLSAVCEQLERAGREDVFDGAEKLADQVEQELEAGLVGLQEYLEQRD
jgi:HPt (histidine-containing phosphotransfer) domain-containing protein